MDAGRTIPYDLLQPADIIVSTTSANVSRVIRVGTFSKVSHACLYVGSLEVIEAIGEGVVNRTIEESVGADTLAIVLRHKNMSAAAAAIIVRYAGRQVGKKYDLAGAASAAPGVTKGFICVVSPALCVGLAGGEAANALDQDAKFFCSELVARAYEQANMRLINRPAYQTNPDDVYTSHVLCYVGNLAGGEF